jgi:hypothetical protein
VKGGKYVSAKVKMDESDLETKKNIFRANVYQKCFATKS